MQDFAVSRPQISKFTLDPTNILLDKSKKLAVRLQQVFRGSRT